MSEIHEPQVICHLDRIMQERDITGAALAREVGITPVNLSVLKNNRAKAVRFSTLAAPVSYTHLTLPTNREV